MKWVGIVLSALIMGGAANAAVLIEEGESTRAPATERWSDSYLNRSTTTTSASEATSFLDAYALRKARQLAVGPTIGGPQGLIGLQAEFNVEPEWSVMAGFGGGDGFRSLTVQARRVFYGTYVAPYVGAGYSRWYSSGLGPVTETTPAFLHDSFLSNRGRETGDFAENIAFSSAGFQYLQLHGPLVGLSIYAEVSALLDLNRLVMLPTGAVGTLYYF